MSIATALICFALRFRRLRKGSKASPPLPLATDSVRLRSPGIVSVAHTDILVSHVAILSDTLPYWVACPVSDS